MRGNPVGSELNQDLPSEPALTVDSRGVDRAQVRRMLSLSPAERLRWLEEIVTDIAALQRLNEKRALR